MYTFRIGVLFIGLFLIRCSQKESNHPVEITWKENKAIEIILSNPSIVDLPEENLNKTLKVELGDTGESMLGEFFKRDGSVIFQPIAPFTRGLHYHVLANGIIFTELNIPLDESAKTPELSIFPSADTVPENILKMYLHFSEPMVEGKSLRHIHLLNDEGDTLQGTFLDLQPELWNVEGTMLTLWFDPGRVKRDLIPNRNLGNPIIKNQKYKLVVDGGWKSKTGKEIGKLTYKDFSVRDRDETIPDINHWNLKAPKPGTTDALVINFREALDYSLIQTSIEIEDQDKNKLKGEYKILEHERGVQFVPNQNWRQGDYTIIVETKLEDLAGNNLQRPFDRDVTQVDESTEKKLLTRNFTLK